MVLALLVIAGGCGSSTPTSQSSTSSTIRTQTEGGDTDAVSSVAAMGIGDLYYVTFDSGSAVIDFSGGNSDASYVLIAQTTEDTNATVSLTTKNIADANITDRFDAMLRENEASLAENEDIAESDLSVGKALGKSVNDTGAFRVLASISSTTRYNEVSATSKCVKGHIEFYVDNAITSNVLDSSDIATLCDQFEIAAAADEAAFGAPSDVNGDGKVVILTTYAVNKLGASGGGIITGYFYASDLFARSSTNPTSNHMEIIYIVAPDPDGIYGTSISKEFAMSNLMTAVVPHELQHAISYNQHVLLNGGSTESSWLNEALSHFAEDYVGFGQENFSRAEVCLESMESYSVVTSGSPGLAERGCSYLFLRYLFERAPNQSAFLSSLENTMLTGRENVVSAFAGDDLNFDEWPEFMRRWAVAVALTNTGISNTAIYQYNDRVWNSTTGHWQGICLICDADDGRGTTLSGPSTSELSSGTVNLSLDGTATAFYTINSPPSTITLSGNASAGLQGVLIRTE